MGNRRSYLTATEVGLVLGIHWLIRRVWFGKAETTMAEILAAGCAAAWVLVRAQWWSRSPTSAARVNQFPIQLLSGLVEAWQRPPRR